MSNIEGSERAIETLAQVQKRRVTGPGPDMLVMGRAVQPPRTLGKYQITSEGKLAIHTSMNWKKTMYAQMMRKVKSRLPRSFRASTEM